MMTRDLFCLRYIHDTFVAHSTHQTSTCSALTFKHLSRRGTKTCIME